MKKIFPLFCVLLLATVAACVAPVAPVTQPLASTAIVEPPPSLGPAPTAEPNTRPPEPAPPNTRPPEPAPPNTRPPEVATPVTGFEAITEAAVKFAAAELGVDAAAIQVISVEEVTWRNSCLGVDRLNEMCMDVITPGFRVVLSVDGQEIAVHTNQDASALRLADPAQGAPDVKPSSYHPAGIWPNS